MSAAMATGNRLGQFLLAVAGDGVELRAAPVCGPVSTALQVGEYQFVGAGAWASCRGWVIMA